jgi:tetratricopeptide (TPR) repeat protein
MNPGINAAKLLLAVAMIGAGIGCAAAADHSAASLYNAANAYARQGNVAMAVLYYERARVLAPNDADVTANLEHVRAAAGLPTQSGSWLENHARLGNPNVLFWCGVVGIALLGTGALTLRFGPSRRRTGWIVAAIGGCLSVAASVDCVSTAPLLHEAVIVQGSPARVSPVPGGDALFTLTAGQVVWVTDAYQNFKLIRTDAGRSGWVAAADVVPVT